MSYFNCYNKNCPASFPITNPNPNSNENKGYDGNGFVGLSPEEYHLYNDEYDHQYRLLCCKLCSFDKERYSRKFCKICTNDIIQKKNGIKGNIHEIYQQGGFMLCFMKDCPISIKVKCQYCANAVVNGKFFCTYCVENNLLK